MPQSIAHPSPSVSPYRPIDFTLHLLTLKPCAILERHGFLVFRAHNRQRRAPDASQSNFPSSAQGHHHHYYQTTFAMSSPATATDMKYRFLGNTGLLVSQFSYGCFMTKDWALDFDQSLAILERAFKSGVNFFDNAEVYAGGHSEVILGHVIKAGIERGTWTREDLVINAKIFFGDSFFETNGINKQGLSRKHIVEGTKATLKRLGLDYVDLIFCHRPDPCTPIEETVRAMNFVIDQGWAFYWGTSEWSAADITEACEIADRLGLIRPAFDQSEYNIFTRSRVDSNFADLYKKYNYGLTTFSPLASGLLTGKYKNGLPADSRLGSVWYKFMADVNNQRAAKAAELESIAEELGCTIAQLALAWCASNEHVSTVVFSATSVNQVEENLKAVSIVPKLTPEIKAKIEAIVPFTPEAVPRYGPMELNTRSRYMTK